MKAEQGKKRAKSLGGKAWQAWARRPARKAAIAVFCLLSAGLSAEGRKHQRPDLVDLNSDKGVEILNKTTLIDSEGNTFSLGALKDRSVLLSFMYTSCGDICPTQTVNLKALRNRLLKDYDSEALPLFVTLTLEPERDTPDVLKKYKQQYGVDEKWVFAATADAKDTLIDILWIGKNIQNGLIAHRSIVYLLDKEHWPVSHYKMTPFDIDYLQRELMSYVKAGF